jgi:predicted PurR-regulated permease PerM
MTDTDRMYYFTQGLTIAALVAILFLGLLPAFLAGLLVYFLIEFGALMMGRKGLARRKGRWIMAVVVAAIPIAALSLGGTALVSYISGGPESFVVLLQKMADIVDQARSYLPVWIQTYVPGNIEEWQVAAAEWLRQNAGNFSIIGKEAGVLLVHILLGGIIGGMIALNPGFEHTDRPLTHAMKTRVGFLGDAFRRIVFSQVRISALNTILTGIFLVIVLPLTGNPLPLTKTMIAVTFIAGLLPVVGNLISNAVIFLIALSVSPLAAAGSLIFLILIHKLEYFLNAHIIGTRIKARAWEILLAMVTMEAVFGIAGVVAAPIYYAYLKDELSARRLI